MEVLNKACDVCGLQKQQTNHWYFAITDRVGRNIEFGFFTPASVVHNPERYIVEDICGQQCAHKRLDRWFESQTANPQPGKESVSA